tara:strand:+ start:191 stop:772 length:582 start_codon:yes stop_codon:yes gene_type:complete
LIKMSIEKNKLIAGFMELPTKVFKSGNLNYYNRHNNTWCEEHELSYDICWDNWLWLVIEKIEKTSVHGDFPIVTISQNSCEIEMYEYTKNNGKFATYFEYGSKTESAYNFVVMFINWYNKKVNNFKKYSATIKWLDTKEIEYDVIFKIGDIEEDDDQIFYYLEDESEIEDYKKEGVADFIILTIDKLKIHKNL